VIFLLNALGQLSKYLMISFSREIVILQVSLTVAVIKRTWMAEEDSKITLSFLDTISFGETKNGALWYESSLGWALV
jgi:hypothetical protein